MIDREFAIAGACLYVPLVLVGVLVLYCKPGRKEWTGVLLASCWQLAFLPTFNAYAQRAGWWSFGDSPIAILGMRLELFLGWVVWWGALSVLLPRLSIAMKVLVFFLLDLALMPLCAPLVELGEQWIVGEVLVVLVCLLPALLLAEWSSKSEQLWGRIVLQGLAFAGILFLLLPSIVIEHTGVGGWGAIEARPRWVNFAFVAAMVISAAPGVAAVGEFAIRGGGTALPLDPPKRLVTSGLYAYVANPMQLSMSITLAIYGWWIGSVLFIGAAVLAVVFSAGLAAWAEAGELERRFGESWSAFRREVKAWCPRWRPYIVEGEGAKVYIAAGCEPCRGVRAFFEKRQPAGVELVDAEKFAGGGLRRMTYIARDGYRVEGVAAVARTLEHCHFGWATLAAVLRLPILSWVLQVVVDASGGGARDLER